MIESLRRHPAAIAAASIAVIVAGLWWMLTGAGAPQPVPEDEAWYFDVVTQQTFTAKALQVPPIESPWGNDAARVYFFSCGQCTEQERFAGYYMKFSDDAKRSLDADPSRWPAALGESHPGRLYSSDGETWVAAPTIAESGVAAALRDKCFGKLRTCR